MTCEVEKHRCIYRKTSYFIQISSTHMPLFHWCTLSFS
ncbi:unnamed protein product [Chondrus crispus]|uniref:Uncharacterized protein n=1 Tax=Chondrus crispus TaxID=2769 RepID=R7QAU0_CHOCR|nr:unnamed protein product [Chondrus crispus]CDF34575.1 unnamed protein product [Chondrus crispus]|eukprot:XP_005714394.1 unnamed protein product [Chondrus crispus]